MPKAKPKAKASKVAAKKPAAKKAKPAAAQSAKRGSAKPVKAAKPAPEPQQAAPQPEPAVAAPVVESTQAAKPQKPAGQHPGKPEQPMWTRFNHGHAQKMSKGRNFRHQGR